MAWLHMHDENLSTLPAVQRLALSYCAGEEREAMLTLLTLDNRLADAVRRAGEPVIAQIKLAWWRDRLGEPPGAWPEGEPLLEQLRGWPGDLAALRMLVDGWEALLSEQFDAVAVDEFAGGREIAWRALARGLRGDDAQDNASAARRWALADLALKLGNPAERDVVRRALDAASPPARPGAVLRPLAVLGGLSLRALQRGSADALDGPGALFAALRIGLSGR